MRLIDADSLKNEMCDGCFNQCQSCRFIKVINKQSTWFPQISTRYSELSNMSDLLKNSIKRCLECEQLLDWSDNE